jgi:hypothetical protein
MDQVTVTKDLAKLTLIEPRTATGRANIDGDIGAEPCYGMLYKLNPAPGTFHGFPALVDNLHIINKGLWDDINASLDQYPDIYGKKKSMVSH